MYKEKFEFEVQTVLKIKNILKIVRTFYKNIAILCGPLRCYNS